jgi:hypothetical protein
MVEVSKRNVQVNVKMCAEDYALLKQAAERLWPEAIISNSGIILGLARIAAKKALSTSKRRQTRKLG